MRFTLEGNNLRILFEENDDPSIECFYTTRDVRTQQFGHQASGRNVWYEPIVKSGIVVPVPRIEIEPNFDLQRRAIREHNELHPLDLYSIVFPDSDPEIESGSDFDADPSFKITPPKRRPVIQIQNSRPDRHVWRLFGTGKHKWVNGLHLDLSDLSRPAREHQVKLLNSFTTKWNKGHDLIPITRGTLRDNEAFNAMLKKDPRCRFFIEPPIQGRKQVRVEWTNRTEIIKLNANNWVARDRYGREVVLRLRGHPRRREMLSIMEMMSVWWDSHTRLVPVTQRGINRRREGNWIRRNPEDANSPYILQEPQEPIAGPSRITPLFPVCINNFDLVSPVETNRGVSESEDSD